MDASLNHTDAPWSRVLEAFSVPIALLDPHGRYLYLNQASKADPVLARGRLGERDLDGCRDDAEMLRRAHRRHRYYAQAVLTKTPVCFAEDVSTPQGEARSFLWLCAPVPGPDGDVAEVAVIGFDITDWCRPVAPSSEIEQRAPSPKKDTLLTYIAQEFRLPLAAMVGLARTLASELTGTLSEQAALIEQGGEHLLQRLNTLPDRVPSRRAKHKTVRR